MISYIRGLLSFYGCRLVSTGRDGFYYDTPTRKNIFMDYDRIEQRDYNEDDFI